MSERARYVGVSDDYAVLSLPGYRVYYGYEVTTGGDDPEWCFQVRTFDNREVLTIPFGELGVRDMYDPAECLLCGMRVLAERGILTLTPAGAP